MNKRMHNLRIVLLIITVLLISLERDAVSINLNTNAEQKNNSLLEKEAIGITYERVKKMTDYQGLSDFEEYNTVYIKMDKKRKDTLYISYILKDCSKFYF